MRKYWEVSKVYMKAQLAWRADVVFHMIFTIARILFAYLLWGIIFQKNDVVGGFSFHSMLSYYIISSFLTQLEMSEGVSREIHERIRNGSFSKYMIIPLSIQGYFTAMELGIVLFYLFFDLIAALVWVFVFQIEFVLITDVWIILCALIMFLLGMLFMVHLNYYLGILTLKFQGIGTFLMIKNNLMALICGSMIPLALFPEPILRLMKVLPFYYVTYLPSMLLIGRCREEAFRGMLTIGCWCVVIQILIMITWSQYRRKYDGVGI